MNDGIWAAISDNMRNFTLGWGILVAVVVGIGTYVSDLKPRLLAFWKSRPVNVTLWFWIKYVTGAALVLLFLHGPPTALDFFALGQINKSYLACAALLHLLAYTIAVCVTCLIRQTVYAGILATGITMTVIVLVPERVPSLARFSINNMLAETWGVGVDSWFYDVYLPLALVWGGPDRGDGHAGLVRHATGPGNEKLSRGAGGVSQTTNRLAPSAPTRSVRRAERPS